MEEGGSISGYVALAVAVATSIVGIVNHKRIRSNCCGKKSEVSLDIENTTPPQSLKITAPPVDETRERQSV
jgi:hypothetical protein